MSLAINTHMAIYQGPFKVDPSEYSKEDREKKTLQINRRGKINYTCDRYIKNIYLFKRLKRYEFLSFDGGNAEVPKWKWEANHLSCVF